MSHTDQHIDAYDWYDPQTNPPQKPFAPRDVYVDYSPAQIASVSSDSSPKNLTSLLSSSSPKIPELLYATSSPAPPVTFFDVTTSPAEPVPFIGVDLSPKWPQETSVDSSPKNIESTSVDTDPYAPLSIAPATDPYPADNIEADSSPKNILSVDEDFFLIDDPLLGLWRFDSEPSDYVSLLSVSQETDEDIFPVGGKYEILKVVDTYTQEGLYSSTTYIETQDAMLGGGEPNQVFDMEDQDTVWSYVKFAAAFDPHNHTIYREVTRPPLPPVLCEHIEETVEVASLEVEFSPSAAVSLGAGVLSQGISSVTVQSSPKPVELQVVAEINTGVTSVSVGLLPEAVSSVTPQSSPKPITSVEPESSPKDITSAVADSTPKPLSSFAVDSTPATVTSVSGESSPKPVTSSEVLSTPSAPISVSGGTLPNSISDISVESTPANVSSILVTDSAPDAVTNVSAGAFTTAPELVLATDSAPIAVTTISSKIIPKSVVSVDVESTPKPVVSVAPDLRPVSPFILHSAILGENSPLVVLVESSPKPLTSIDSVELASPVESLEVIATPKAVGSVSVGAIPLPLSTLDVESTPKAVLSLAPLRITPVSPVASLDVFNLSTLPLAPAQVFISRVAPTLPVAPVLDVFVDSTPRPVAGISGGNLSGIPIAPVVLVSSYNEVDTGTGTGTGLVPGTGGYAPSRPTAVGAYSSPKDVQTMQAIAMYAAPPESIEVESSPHPVSGVLPVNQSAPPFAPEVLQVIGVIVQVIREAIPEPPEVIQVTAVLYPTQFVDPPFQPSVLLAELLPDAISFIDATDKPPLPVSFWDATASPPLAPTFVSATDDSLPPEAATTIRVVDAYILDGGSVIEKFYVSGGQLSQPYFTFTDEFGTSVDYTNIQLRPGRSYIFETDSGFNVNHPFNIGTYIEESDTWAPLDYIQPPSIATIGGRIEFTVPEDFDTETENIGFYCNIHPGVMNGNLPTTNEPKVDGGGVPAGGSGDDGAGRVIDGGGGSGGSSGTDGTDPGLFDQVSVPLRIEVDTTPFPVSSVESRNNSIPFDPTSLEIEVFYEAVGGTWFPAEVQKEDDYYAWWDSNELVNGIPSWHPSSDVTGLDEGYNTGSFGNYGNYLIYGSNPVEQTPDDFSSVISGGGLPNRYKIIGGDDPVGTDNWLMLANKTIPSTFSGSSPASYSNYYQAISRHNNEYIFVLKLQELDPGQFTYIEFNDYGHTDSTQPYKATTKVRFSSGSIRVILEQWGQDSNGDYQKYTYTHTENLSLPTDKPIIVGIRKYSDGYWFVGEETSRTITVSVNGSDVLEFDVYDIPNSGNYVHFWYPSNILPSTVSPDVLGDTRFAIYNSDLGLLSDSYVGDIIMVGQKMNQASVADPRLPVESVEVEVLTAPRVIESLCVTVQASFVQSTISEAVQLNNGLLDLYILNDGSRGRTDTNLDCGGWYQMYERAIEGTSGLLATSDTASGVHYERKYFYDGSPVVDAADTRRYIKYDGYFYDAGGNYQTMNVYGLSSDPAENPVYSGYGAVTGFEINAPGLIWQNAYLSDDEWKSPALDRFLL